MSLKHKAIAGIKWTSISALVVAAVQLCQYSFLTRILSPSDFGLMALILVVIGFSNAFSDMGITNAIIHHNCNKRQLSSLYWLNIASGIVLLILIMIFAPVFGWFYDEERIVSLLRLLSLSFVLTAMGNQYKVLFQKELYFNTIAKIDIFSVVMSCILSVCLAINGCGIYSLIYGSLSQSFLSSVLFLYFGLKKFGSPELSFSHKEVQSFYSFGFFQMGERSINFFNTQFDVMILGKVLGPGPTGIYYIAKIIPFKIYSLINPIVTRVTMPIMAKISEDNYALRRFYLKSNQYLSYVSFPLYLLIFVLSNSIILIFFGPKWLDAVPVLRLLSLYLMIRSTGNTVGTLLIAKGRADLGFYWNFSLLFIIPFSIYLGSFWGGEGVAAASVLLMILLIIPSWKFLINPTCPMDLKSYLNSFLKPFLLSLTACTVSVIGLYLTEGLFAKTLLVISFVIAIYALLLYKFERDFIELLRKIHPF